MKIAIIDFDGVIADSLDMQITVVNKFSEEFGYLKIKSKKEYRQYSMQEVIEHIRIPKERLDEAVKKIKKEASKKYNTVPLFKGVQEVLSRMGEEYKLIIVSSNEEKTIKDYLTKNKIRKLFHDKIYTSSGLFNKYQIIDRIIKKFKVSPEDVLFIGDEQRDIETGKRLKIKTVAITWGYDSRNRLLKEKPDLIVNKPEELLALVD